MSKQADQMKAVEALETFLAKEYTVRDFMKDVALVQQQMFTAMSHMDNDHLDTIDTRQISGFSYFAIRMAIFLEPFANQQTNAL